MVTLHQEKFYEELGSRNFLTMEELKQFVTDFLNKRFYDEGYFYEKKDRKELCHTVAKKLTDAIYEDVCTEFFASALFRRCDYEISGNMSEKITCERCEYGQTESASKRIYCDFFYTDFSLETIFNMDMLNDIVKEALSTPGDGLSSYASRYPSGEDYKKEDANKLGNLNKVNNFEESMKRNFKLLTKHICPMVYKYIYPVFLLIMLDADHSKKYKDDGFWKLFLAPIYHQSDLERYTFSLLAHKRQAKEKRENTIFTVAKNKLIRHLRNKKAKGERDEIFVKYENEEIERRKKILEACEEMDAETYCALHPGITRVLTPIEPIDPELLNSYPDLLMKNMQCKCFESKPANKSLFELYRTEIEEAKEELKMYINAKEQKKVFFPDMRNEDNRMYFVNVIRDILLNEKNSGNREKKVLKNNLCMLNDLIKIGDKNGLDAPFVEFFLYFLNRLTGWVNFYFYANSKNMRNAAKWYKDTVYENMIAISYCVKKYFHEYDDDLLDTIRNICGAILNNENYFMEIPECKIYMEIFSELCINFENSYTGGVIDVLNYYYDLYIKDEVEREVGEAFRNLCMPIYTHERYLEELEDSKLNEKSLKDRARHLFETILEKQDPSAVLNVLRTSFDDNKGVLKL